LQPASENHKKFKKVVVSTLQHLANDIGAATHEDHIGRCSELTRTL
jgi:hypothetical protein